MGHPRLLLLALAVTASTLGQSPLGFRTDGTGRYPDADPPLRWGKDRNVVWHIALTQSNAIPIILGDRLFTCAEPCVLLCINKADGEVLWRKESSYKKIPLTEKEKGQVEAERKQDGELAKKQSALEKVAYGRKFRKVQER